jgi:hypothetical protein
VNFDQFAGSVFGALGVANMPHEKKSRNAAEHLPPEQRQ